MTPGAAISAARTCPERTGHPLRRPPTRGCIHIVDESSQHPSWAGIFVRRLLSVVSMVIYGAQTIARLAKIARARMSSGGSWTWVGVDARARVGC
ncbi:hypothetical protein SCOCK_110017 [Actinacidiphila cocklensis]|uniref:Uncharacterized protein n=1 Tax=Actinacidiphila cocklensis TaxID=887465 RepID=A0A9W4DJE0_9ACTN|nr:hypothetical protein SCOCK_110017 [Actinacidiphila cocklensis]